MKVYKNGALFFESTDSATLEAMIDSISNSLYNNHYTKGETMSLIASARSVYQVATMPSNPSRNVLYYVGSSSPYNVKLVDSNGTIVDLGSSEVDLTDYVKKSDIATSFSASSTNDKVAGALAAFNSFAPKQSGTYVGQFLAPNNCILPFGFSRQLNMSNERATINGMFVSQMVDPINSSINLFGALKVMQQCYGGSSGGTATNIVIEQTFETFLRGTPTQRKVFFRRGYVANSATDIDINDTSAIANAITWMNWYPLEYPRISLSIAPDATNITNLEATYSVAGGIMTIQVRHLRSSVDISRTTSYNAISYPDVPKKEGLMFGMLYPFDTTETTPCGIQPKNGGLIEIFGVKANIRYIGYITMPLGY